MKYFFAGIVMLNQSLVFAGNMSGGGGDPSILQSEPIMFCTLDDESNSSVECRNRDFSIFLSGNPSNQTQNYEFVFTKTVKTKVGIGNPWFGLNLLLINGPEINFENGGWQLQKSDEKFDQYRSFAIVWINNNRNQYSCFTNIPKNPDCDIIDCCTHHPTSCGGH
ncbi:MAG: hypothetical protein NT027_18330 [Proteobacteria bacterium]|nr:hypothetical protein [Pseudomonadota bacterium]